MPTTGYADLVKEQNAYLAAIAQILEQDEGLSPEVRQGAVAAIASQTSRSIGARSACHD